MERGGEPQRGVYQNGGRTDYIILIQEYKYKKSLPLFYRTLHKGPGHPPHTQHTV